jgi:cell division protease FtsH
MDDMSEAMDRVDLGMETHLTRTREELEKTAYHEAGHAVIMYLLHPTDDVFKITLKSYGNALGHVQPNPREESHSESRDKLLADIMVSLAGYGAEKIKYGNTTTGVSGDFRRAMAIANSMVWKVGMGISGFVGDFSIIPKEEISTSLKERLNNETIAILNSCNAKVEEVLKENWAVIDDIVKMLLETKEMDFDDLEEIFDKHGRKKETLPVPLLMPPENAKIDGNNTIFVNSDDKEKEKK